LRSGCAQLSLWLRSVSGLKSTGTALDEATATDSGTRSMDEHRSAKRSEVKLNSAPVDRSVAPMIR
jgi:hypothetical protein